MTASTPRWATKREAATYARISIATLDRWFTARHITRYGTGRHIRVDLNQIDAYFLRNQSGKKAS